MFFIELWPKICLGLTFTFTLTFRLPKTLTFYIRHISVTNYILQFTFLHFYISHSTFYMFYIFVNIIVMSRQHGCDSWEARGVHQAVRITHCATETIDNCTFYILHFYILQFTSHIVHFTFYIFTFYILHFTFFTFYILHFTCSSSQITFRIFILLIFYISHFTFYISHFTFFTFYIVHFTCYSLQITLRIFIY